MANKKRNTAHVQAGTSSRKLAAIMFTDMVGYTAMSQKDEALAVELLEEQRRILRPIFRKHSGREIDTIGDAFLVEFPNSLDAVKCAIEIQTFLKKFDEQRIDERKILLRIGIHLGDVIHKGKNVSGDAVNVASRIEPLASPGGVCLSAQVYYTVYNKVPCKFESLGNPHLKNVSMPIEVFRISGLGDGVRPQTQQLTLLPKTRIAVLPFANMSPDPSDEYFADGMTEELISTISKISSLQVIARTSVIRYKGGSKSIEEIGRELKVGTILEGSVRKAGEKLRITAQLIDSQDSRHLWSESYDRELKDIFTIQSDISNTVANELKVKLLAQEKESIAKPLIPNMDSYLAYLRGRSEIHLRTPEALRNAKKNLELAIALDNRNARAYCGLADVNDMLAGYANEKIDQEQNRLLVLKALELDQTLAEAHASLAMEFRRNYKYHQAEKEFIKAIELNPGYATAHHWHAQNLETMGLTHEALRELQVAEELDPLSVIIVLAQVELYLWLGKLDGAFEKLKKAERIGGGKTPFYHSFLSDYWIMKSDFERALNEIRLYEESVKDTPEMLPVVHGHYAYYYHAKGEKAKALSEFHKLEALPDSQWRSLYLAASYFHSGELDLCFKWLSRLFDEHNLDFRFFVLGPNWAPVRNDPRFMDLVKKTDLEIVHLK